MRKGHIGYIAISCAAIIATPGIVFAADSADTDNCQQETVNDVAKVSGQPDVPTVTGTRVTIGECVTERSTPEGGPVAAIFTALVSKGLSYIGSALSHAAASHTCTALATRNVEQLEGNKCIQIVRGTFYVNKPKVWPQLTASDWPPKSNPDTATSKLGQNGAWLYKAPDFFFEGRFVKSKDGTGTSIRPTYAMLANPIPGEGSGDRSINVFFSFTKPGTSPDVKNAPAASITLGKIVPSKPLVVAADTTNAYESSWFSLSDDDAKKAAIVAAEETETKSGSAFFKFLADIFGDQGVQSALSTSAMNILVPPKVDEGGLQDRAEGAFVEAVSALDSCQVGNNSLSAGQTAKSKLRVYIIAAKSAPNAPFVGPINVDSINLGNVPGVSAACVG